MPASPDADGALTVPMAHDLNHPMVEALQRHGIEVPADVMVELREAHVHVQRMQAQLRQLSCPLEFWR